MSFVPSRLPARFFTWLILACFLTALGAATARAQAEDTKTIGKVTDLNKKALEAYAASDFNKARKLLKQALDLCGSAGLDKHPIAARTHIHMGVIMVGGLNQRDLAIKQFAKALEIQPDIQVTKNVATPDVLAAFKEAADSAPAAGPEGGAAADSGGGEGASDSAGGGAEGGDAAGAAAAPAGETGIVHTPVTKGRPGAPILITAKIGSDVTGYSKVVLGYRPAGTDEFVTKGMSRAGNKFAAQIPSSATHGKQVAYYIEAQDSDATVMSSAGSATRPYLVNLGGGAACGDDDENCTAGGGGGESEGDPGHKFFLALAGGFGGGLATGHGDLTADHKVKAGFAPASIAQIAPEIGYFLAPDFRLSLQGRYQIVSGGTMLNLNALQMVDPSTDTGRCGSSGLCKPATSAIAVLARGTWFFGGGSFRPYASVAVGGGQIRHLVKFGSPNVCGNSGGQSCIDTVTAGPVLLGGGGGLSYGLTDNFGLLAEVNALAAFTKVTINFDLNLGIALRL